MVNEVNYCMSFFQRGAGMEAVDGRCVNSYYITEHLPHSVRGTSGLLPFLGSWRLVQYVWEFSALVCHICRSHCHVLYRQDSEEKVGRFFQFVS